jgi:hypothetical protein
MFGMPHKRDAKQMQTMLREERAVVRELDSTFTL